MKNDGVKLDFRFFEEEFLRSCVAQQQSQTMLGYCILLWISDQIEIIFYVVVKLLELKEERPCCYFRGQWYGNAEEEQ